MNLRDTLIKRLSEPTLKEGEREKTFLDVQRISDKLDDIAQGVAFLLRESQLRDLAAEDDGR